MTDSTQLTKSKIVCTLGPASDTPNRIAALAAAGMDCARINFSHGSPDEHRRRADTVRTSAPDVALLCDIQGPKIRIGEISEGTVWLAARDPVTLTTEIVSGDARRFTVSHAGLPHEVSPGERIYINDGLVCLEVVDSRGSEIHCTVLNGGPVASRKGVNLPSTRLSLAVPTEKDVSDLRDIAALAPEYVAVSFVERGVDLERVRACLREAGNDSAKLIAKIERPAARDNIAEILAAADGLMVARGDLGVEIPPEEVVPCQKELIRVCNIAGKPVIVATQMLESMVHSPRPTRAEVSDVYNAIEDGADAVMLSAETATGKHALAAVGIMQRIVATAEARMPPRPPDAFDSGEHFVSEITGHLVAAACRELGAVEANGRIVCLTATGRSVRMLAKYRPPLPILAVTGNPRTARELRLVWGAEPIVLPGLEACATATEGIRAALREAVARGLLQPQQTAIVAANFLDPKAPVNTCAIVPVDG